MSEKLPSFQIADQEAWDSYVKANVDPYGAACVLYAAKWASLMDNYLSDGKRLEDIADSSSHEADQGIGITGFMYGCAVGMLSKAWKHGEALRRWHNLKTQIGREGEQANASGSVLNPALLMYRERPQP